MKPFLKWAGGKRWLVNRPEVNFPEFTGKYIEPFLGGGAVYFHLRPEAALLSDANSRLVDTYLAIKNEWGLVERELRRLQKLHSRDFYYEERRRSRRSRATQAAQFIYLNRTCWNGLYRENLKGEFNVPVGTKNKVIFEDESFEEISELLRSAEIVNSDFECSINRAVAGDFVFADPPYTTAHNHNGFVKYNQKIFSWDDQIRLKESIFAAVERGVHVMVTNADHESIHELYEDVAKFKSVGRPSVIAGKASKRTRTSEVLYSFCGQNQASL